MNIGRPLTVLHVLEDLDSGGAERQLVAHLKRSDPGRFCHIVCALAAGGRFSAALESAGIPVHVLGITAPWNLTGAALRLGRIVRATDPDVIHTTLYRPTVTGRVVGRLCRKPVVTTLVNESYEPEWRLDNPRLNRGKVWAVRTIDRFTASRWSTAFVAISQTVRASAIRRLGILPHRITVIPRGLAVDELPVFAVPQMAEVRASLGWGDAYPVIINIGRLVPQKGQKYAIVAMRDVLARFPAARLVIAGEGWLHSALYELIRAHGLERHVTLLGQRDDVDALLHAADLFVFPSLTEGAGNALLEAMAAGKPCVASRIPAILEYTGDGKVVFLSEPRSPASLAENLLRLADDRAAAARLGCEAQAWVRTRYDIRTSLARLETLYEQVALSTGATHDHL